MDSSLKVERMYSSMRTMDISWVGCGAPGALELTFKSEGAGVVLAGLPKADPLTSRELGADLLLRPNQWGKP